MCEPSTNTDLDDRKKTTHTAVYFFAPDTLRLSKPSHSKPSHLRSCPPAKYNLLLLEEDGNRLKTSILAGRRGDPSSQAYEPTE